MSAPTSAQLGYITLVVEPPASFARPTAQSSTVLASCKGTLRYSTHSGVLAPEPAAIMLGARDGKGDATAPLHPDKAFSAAQLVEGVSLGRVLTAHAVGRREVDPDGRALDGLYHSKVLSRKHALLKIRAGQLTITEMAETKNGTFYWAQGTDLRAPGAKLRVGHVQVLTDGDVIAMGETTKYDATTRKDHASVRIRIRMSSQAKIDLATSTSATPSALLIPTTPSLVSQPREREVESSGSKMARAAFDRASTTARDRLAVALKRFERRDALLLQTGAGGDSSGSSRPAGSGKASVRISRPGLWTLPLDIPPRQATVSLQGGGGVGSASASTDVGAAPRTGTISAPLDSDASADSSVEIIPNAALQAGTQQSAGPLPLSQPERKSKYGISLSDDEPDAGATGAAIKPHSAESHSEETVWSEVLRVTKGWMRPEATAPSATDDEVEYVGTRRPVAGTESEPVLVPATAGRNPPPGADAVDKAHKELPRDANLDQEQDQLDDDIKDDESVPVFGRFPYRAHRHTPVYRPASLSAASTGGDSPRDDQARSVQADLVNSDFYREEDGSDVDYHQDNSVSHSSSSHQTRLWTPESPARSDPMSNSYDASEYDRAVSYISPNWCREPSPQVDEYGSTGSPPYGPIESPPQGPDLSRSPSPFRLYLEGNDSLASDVDEDADDNGMLSKGYDDKDEESLDRGDSEDRDQALQDEARFTPDGYGSRAASLDHHCHRADSPWVPLSAYRRDATWQGAGSSEVDGGDDYGPPSPISTGGFHFGIEAHAPLADPPPSSHNPTPSDDHQDSVQQRVVSHGADSDDHEQLDTPRIQAGPLHPVSLFADLSDQDEAEDSAQGDQPRGGRFEWMSDAERKIMREYLDPVQSQGGQHDRIESAVPQSGAPARPDRPALDKAIEQAAARRGAYPTACNGTISYNLQNPAATLLKHRGPGVWLGAASTEGAPAEVTLESDLSTTLSGKARASRLLSFLQKSGYEGKESEEAGPQAQQDVVGDDQTVDPETSVSEHLHKAVTGPASIDTGRRPSPSDLGHDGCALPKHGVKRKRSDNEDEVATPVDVPVSKRQRGIAWNMALFGAGALAGMTATVAGLLWAA